MSLRSVVVRAALVAAAPAVPAVAWWLCAPTLVALRRRFGDGQPAGVELDLLLAAMATAVLALALLWLGSVVLAAAVEAATGRTSRLARRITPALLRRTLLAAFGLALGTGPVLTSAVAVSSPPLPAPTHSTAPVGGMPELAGLRLPERQVGEAPTPTDDQPAQRAARPPAAGTHRVRTGECLWSIAADRLPPDVDLTRIDEAWRALYRTNREVVGPDPDLLRPGTVLRLPQQPQPSASSPQAQPSTGRDRR